MSILNFLTYSINIYALILTLLGVVPWTKKLRHSWRTRHLRKVWGIKNGDSVILVCSELEDPEHRQYVEPREFIYNLKYGDVDAYFEAVITLLRLYPGIRLRIMSAGEAATARMDLTRHLILIGGPDYNAVTEQVLSQNITQFDYRSPDMAAQSSQHPEEIVLYDKLNDKEYYYTTHERDYGYFERIVNPHNPESNIVLIGGCHTIGVTGAVKAFSMADSESGELSRQVLNNGALVARRVRKAKKFSIVVSVERVGQTIAPPAAKSEDITARTD